MKKKLANFTVGHTESFGNGKILGTATVVKVNQKTRTVTISTNPKKKDSKPSKP